MGIHRHLSVRSWACLALSGLAQSGPVAGADDSDPWRYQLYADAGYAASNRDPADDSWPGKSTTATLNSPGLFLAIDDRMSVAFRPEFYRDADGLITGARQTLRATTGTFRYQLSPRHQRLVGTLELRYDRSSGAGGGFPDGPDNDLVSDQAVILFGLLWSFDR